MENHTYGDSEENESWGDALMFRLKEYFEDSSMTFHMKNVKGNFESHCLKNVLVCLNHLYIISWVTH